MCNADAVEIVRCLYALTACIGKADARQSIILVGKEQLGVACSSGRLISGLVVEISDLCAVFFCFIADGIRSIEPCRCGEACVLESIADVAILIGKRNHGELGTVVQGVQPGRDNVLASV